MKDNKSDRDPNAIACPSGYLIDLYCCRPDCNAQGEATAEGAKAYSKARTEAKRQGWILHKDGYATCPKCAKKYKKP